MGLVTAVQHHSTTTQQGAAHHSKTEAMLVPSTVPAEAVHRTLHDLSICKHHLCIALKARQRSLSDLGMSVTAKC